MHCNGKCYLMKQLNAVNKDPSAPQNSSKLIDNTLSVHTIDIADISNIYNLRIKKTYPFFKNSTSNIILSQVTPPPRCA